MGFIHIGTRPIVNDFILLSQDIIPRHSLDVDTRSQTFVFLLSRVLLVVYYAWHDLSYINSRI